MRTASKLRIFFLYFILMPLLLEGGLRTYFFVKSKFVPRSSKFIKTLGWVNAPNLSKPYTLEPFGTVKYTTNKMGFQRFGDPGTTKTKIFFIGDSYTQAGTTTQGKGFYDYIQDKIPVEIFVYGGMGYGSLQEYLILEIFFAIIKPDLVVWQFADNDLVNNHPQIESASYRHNNHMTRPYWQSGKIIYRFPHQDYGWTYNLLKSSYLLKVAKIQINALKQQTQASIEKRLTRDHPWAEESLQAMSSILDKATALTAGTPIIAFTVNTYTNLPGWVGDEFKRIAKTHQIHYIERVALAIAEAKAAGKIVDGSQGVKRKDQHWNDLGHEIVGNVITEYLLNNQLIRNP